MAKKFQPVDKGITPKGVLVFPYLNKPDDKFKSQGEYRAKLKLSGDDAAKFAARCEEAYEKALNEVVEQLKAKETNDAKRAKITRKSLKVAVDGKPWKAVEDDEGNETGEIAFTFKKNASYKDKKTEEVKPLKIDLFDAAKNKWPKEKLIYGGSSAKIAFEAYSWYTPSLGAGMKLQLCGAQIIELVSGSSRSADDYGFDEEGAGQAAESEGDDTPADSEGGPEGAEEF